MKRRITVAVVILAAVAAAIGLYVWLERPPRSLVLTGIVSTDDVRVSSQVAGRIEKLLVHQGDTVKKDELLALIQPREWQADQAYYESSERAAAAQVTKARADLRLLEQQTREQIREAQANLASAEAQVVQARADLEYARRTFDRTKALRSGNISSQQDYEQARANYDSAKGHVKSLDEQVRAARAALALARTGSEQIAASRAALSASVRQLDAARAQTEKSKVLLGYTQIRAPIAGIVDVRAALQGEVVTAGQAIVTLVNPDNLWVRADVEESYIDRVHLGEKMTVRLPSGATREGTVFFRGVDADYATQRDVSRTKRDIKTFQIRLRCDNRDRSLALGMTAYVTLPLGGGA